MIRNICIRTRLLLAFFMISFFTLLAGIIGFMSLRNIGDDAVKSIDALAVLNDMYDYNVEADNGIYYMLRFRNTLIREYLDEVTAERIEKLQSFMADFIKLHQNRFRHIFTPGEEQDMANILQIYNEAYLPILNEIFELHNNGESERAISLYERRLDPIYCAIFYNVGNAFDKVFASTQETVANNSRHASASAAFLILMIFASFVMAIILTLVVTKSISTPLESLRHTAEKMAQGNLDVDFNKGCCGCDEFTHLSTSLNETVCQLKEVQRLRLEAIEIRYEKEKAEAATVAKSRFLAKMSHEIRTPMNAIVGMAELAMRENIPPAAYEQVQTIKQAGANLLSIINDLLDFSKIESGRVDIIADDYDFSSLINDVTGIIKTRIIDRPLTFIVDVDENIPNGLHGDEVRIRQVLLNVLSNAVKYTEKGSIKLTVRGETAETEEGVTVNLTMDITDTGRGIKKEDIGKLFSEFVQVDQASNKGIEGTGLGLAITWNLVKAMGGDITVASEYGAGSTVTVKLPQKLGVIDISSAKRNTQIFIAPDAKILVVDDIDTNLKVAAGLLSPYSMQIKTCISGAAAIKAVSEETFDLIFMDHMMPEMDGVEATKRIREMDNGRYEKLPIVALTANAVSGMKEMFLNYGFNDFLSKPVETIKLNMVLEQWISDEKKIRAIDPESFNKTAETININIPGIDTQKGAAMSGGTAQNYIQTLAVFAKDGRKKIIELKKAHEEDALHLYTTHVHALKSAAANIGAHKLSESARVLETAGNEKNRDFINANNKKMLGELEQILNGIDKYLAANAEAQSAAVDVETVKTELAKLKTAIDGMNASAINEAVKQLKQFISIKDTGAAVDNILQSTLVGEYDEAAELADKLLKSLERGN